MQNTKATSVGEYLANLPPERRKELAAVRSVVKKHLPKGYEETLQYGMISYVVPLRTFPEGYLGKKDVPLPYVSLGAQKNYLSLYLLTSTAMTTSSAGFARRTRGAGRSSIWVSPACASTRAPSSRST